MNSYVAAFPHKHEWQQEITRRFAPRACTVRFFDLGDPALSQSLADADFVTVVKLPGEVVPFLRTCRLVQMVGVGYDLADLAALRRARIPLAITPDGTGAAVSEHTFMLMLAVSRLVIPLHQELQRGNFLSQERRKDCHLLQGRTLGIIGLGRIGKSVARLARAFGMDVVYNDIAEMPRDLEVDLRLERLPLSELLARADVVTIHTPLTPLTRGLVGETEFARMKHGAIFLNTSRGQTYDLDALYAALRSGHLAGAGLDVFEPEPPPRDHPILRLDNVVLSPHMAAGTLEAFELKTKAQFENFERVARGLTPLHLVDEPG